MANDIYKIQFKLAIPIFLTIVIVVLVWQSIQITSGIEKAERAADTLSSLWGPDTDLIKLMRDLPHIHGTVARAQDDLTKARSDLTLISPLSHLFGWVPVLGDKLEQGNEMLELGEEITKGSLDLLFVFNQMVELSRGPILIDGIQINQSPFKALTNNKPRLESAIKNFESAKVLEDSLSDRDLGPKLERLLNASQRVSTDMKALSVTGLSLSNSWKSLLGFDKPVRYLLVAHNSDELRASGGYIPGAWLLSLNKGSINHLKFWDTVAVDNLERGNPSPPGGIVQSLWGGVWLFRDAGWSPNYPTSANVIQQLFKLGTGEEVDGIIAVNQWAVEEILSAVGPVSLPNGELLDESGYIRVLEMGKDQDGRKFMDTALDGLLSSLTGDDSSSDIAALIMAILNSVDEKHLMPYFENQELQNQILVNGWSGGLEKPVSDYLMIVDSNVGWNKVDRNIKRSIDYSVNLSSDGLSEVELELTYTNVSTPRIQDACAIQTPSVAGATYHEMKHGCYWNYLRVYVPGNTALNIASPLPMPAGAIYRRLGYNDIEETLNVYPEGNHQVISGFFNVAPDEVKKLSFTYQTPIKIAGAEDNTLIYELIIQKQSGIKSLDSNIVITAPEGHVIKQADPTPTLLTPQSAQFNIQLKSDTKVWLSIHKN